MSRIYGELKYSTEHGCEQGVSVVVEWMVPWSAWLSRVSPYGEHIDFDDIQFEAMPRVASISLMLPTLGKPVAIELPSELLNRKEWRMVWVKVEKMSVLVGEMRTMIAADIRKRISEEMEVAV